MARIISLITFGLAALVATTNVVTPAAAAPLSSGKLIVAYAPTCSEKVYQEAKEGVNVVVWFAVNMVVSKRNGPEFIGNLGVFNVTCMAEIAKRLEKDNIPTTHLLGVGGWAMPHPDTSISGEKWADYFFTYNQNLKATYGWSFDGIDWDLEGANELKSPINRITAAEVDLIGTMSQALKKSGYVVSLVPPQSYMDPTLGKHQFSLNLNLSYADYHPDFWYHGWGAYAAFIGKYGIDTFDFVDVQLYESWARADQAVNTFNENPSTYLSTLAAQFANGWFVPFSLEPSLGIADMQIAVPYDKLVIGFSNGLGGTGRSVFIDPSQVKDFYVASANVNNGNTARGAMFWNCDLDGQGANGGNTPVYFARGYNSYLNVRN